MKKYVALLIGLSFVPLVSFGAPSAPAPAKVTTVTIKCPEVPADVHANQVLPGDGKIVREWLVQQGGSGKISPDQAKRALIVDRIIARQNGNQIICIDKKKAFKVVATVNHVQKCSKINSQAVCLRNLLPQNG